MRSRSKLDTKPTSPVSRIAETVVRRSRSRDVASSAGGYGLHRSGAGIDDATSRRACRSRRRGTDVQRAGGRTQSGRELADGALFGLRGQSLRRATHHYWTNLHAAKPVVSAILATVLWPLLLVGINLHIH